METIKWENANALEIGMLTQAPKAAASPANVSCCCPVKVEIPSPFFTAHLSITISPNVIIFPFMDSFSYSHWFSYY